MDIFDTLVWRRVPEPEDLFLILGRTLAAAGKLAPHVSPIQFAELRKSAQRAAREKAEAATGYREIRLADVYAGLPDVLFAPGFETRARIDAELAAEKSFLVLDEDLAGLIRFAKAAGAQVFFVSDTYFSTAEIWDLLAAAGFKDKALVNRLYVSCESGRPKFRDLFDIVLKDAGVPPASYAHVGDNMDADIHPGRHRGMATVHYDKWIFAPRVQTEEFTADPFQRGHLIGTRGDLGLTGLRGRLFHRAPESISPENRFFWSYGAAILAPVFAGFARWVLSQSQGAPIYGLMREGRFLARVLTTAAADLGVKVYVRELWLSRRAVIRSALYDDNLRFLPEAIALSPGASAQESIASLGLTLADIKAVMPDFDFGQPNSQNRLANAIASTVALKQKVVARSAELRGNLLKGLRAKVDFGQPIVLMDLGYAATIQSVLARILKREGQAPPITGLYLAANEKAVANIREGADIRTYLNESGFTGLTGVLLTRTPDVLEHACMCREGSLAEYDADGKPVLLPNQRAGAQLGQMEAMQEGILAGVKAINGLLGSLAQTPAELPELKAQIDRIIQASLLHPTKQEAETIGAWHHEANFDLSDVRRLKDFSFDAGALQYKGWPALQDIGRAQVYWPAAAFTAAAPFFGQVYAAGARAAYSVDHLTSGPTLGALIITPDLGIGFDTRREGAVPLTVNAFGRGEISVTVKAMGPEAFQRLRLKLPAARAIFSLDMFTASFVGERDHRAVNLLDDNARRITWANAEPTAANVLTTAKEGAMADVDISGDVPPWVHMLTLRLRYKYLRLDELFR